MITLRALPGLIAAFVFIICVPLGLLRLGLDIWNYYHPAVAGAPKVFQDHHGLGMILLGLVFSSIFALWFWLLDKKAA